MDDEALNAPSSADTLRIVLTDYAWLARQLTGAEAIQLQAAGESVVDGETKGQSLSHPFPGGQITVYGGIPDETALEPLLRRISNEVEAHRRAISQKEEHATALATAERANEIARSSARRFEALFEGLPVACYACDAEGRLVEWNRAAEEIWGAAIATAWGEEVASVVDPDHPDAEHSVLARALAGETIGNEEREVRVGEGMRWHLVSMFPLRDEAQRVVGAMGARLDITRRRAAQRDLAEREARFRTVLEALHEGLTVVDETGRLVLRNASAERILRLSPDAADLGAEFPEGTVVDVDGKPMALDHWPLSIALRTGQPARDVLLGLVRSGFEGRIWISVNAEPLLSPDGEAPIGAVATFREVDPPMASKASARA